MNVHLRSGLLLFVNSIYTTLVHEGYFTYRFGYSVLECDAECALIERNRRLALALEIKNPDLGNKLGTPSFSDFLKDFAK